MAEASKQKGAAEVAVAAHYGLLLGINSPWQVRRVDLKLEANRVEVDVGHDPDSAVVCPECGRDCPRSDHAPQRQWRHLDVMQFATIIRARVPRCECPEHGVVTVKVPWAEPHGRFTLMFEAFAVTVIEAARSFVQAMEILKVDWHTIQEIVRRAGERGLLRRSTEAVKHVGMDEKSFGRGQDYVSLMTDLSGRRVLDVVKDRDTASALKLWECLPEPQRERVEAVALDMSPEFTSAAQQAARRAVIVYDKFHVAKHLNEAVDKVRREEHRRLPAGRQEPHRHQIPVASGRLRRRRAGVEFRGAVRAQPEDCPRLVSQGDFHRVLGATECAARGQVLPAVVRRRAPVQARSDQEDRTDAADSSVRAAQLLPASHHQCHLGRLQLEDSGDQG